jgi:hypothetical protein
VPLPYFGDPSGRLRIEFRLPGDCHVAGRLRPVGDRPGELFAACFGRVSGLLRGRFPSTLALSRPPSADSRVRHLPSAIPQSCAVNVYTIAVFPGKVALPLTLTEGPGPPNADARAMDIPSGFFKFRNDMHEAWTRGSLNNGHFVMSPTESNAATPRRCVGPTRTASNAPQALPLKVRGVSRTTLGLADHRQEPYLGQAIGEVPPSSGRVEPWRRPIWRS